MEISKAKNNSIYFRVIEEIKKNGISVVYLDSPENIQIFGYSMEQDSLEANFETYMSCVCQSIKKYAKDNKCMINISFIDFGGSLGNRIIFDIVYHAEKIWYDVD